MPTLDRQTGICHLFRMKRREFIKGIAVAGVSACGLSALGQLLIPFADAATVPGFSFAHITDLHLDVDGTNSWQHRERSVALFIDALRQVGRLPKLDFIVFGGDQIHAGPHDRESLKVFRRWVAQLDVPYYVLLGNTEVSPIPGSSTLGRDEYLRIWKGRGLRPGRSSWAFNPVRGVRFIGFDVTMDGKPQGGAFPGRIRWLRRELEANRGKKLIIVATHQLLHPTTPKDLTPEWSLWMVKNHDQVKKLLARHRNVRLVISGHHHASRVETVGRITFVSDPAIVSYPCAFRVFTIGRKGIHVKNIALSDRTMVLRARELLLTDPYARTYDLDNPRAIASYSEGLSEEDRETKILL